MRPDLTLVHPPSIYDFRRRTVIQGPVSTVVPSSSVFEMYPIGFVTISEYLERKGKKVRIVNLANLMMADEALDVPRYLRSLSSPVFGIDLHWLAHAHGSVAVAQLIRQCHPEAKVLFGGLSASYYHEELIRNPHIDFVLRGDSTEEPLNQVLDLLKNGGDLSRVPNLTWKDANHGVHVNPLTYAPGNLDDFQVDYEHMLRKSMSFRDVRGYMPFHDWMRYPITAVFPIRGCDHNCVICGGSAYAYRHSFGRKRTAFRSPQQIAEGMVKTQRFLRSPMIMLCDLQMGGHDYAMAVLDEIRKARIKSEVVLELFSPPPLEFLEAAANALERFNIEISPESHDEVVRDAFGRDYSNAQLEEMIERSLALGCRRLDLFFMIGLPKQTPESVLATVDYCEDLMRRYGADQRVMPLIAPLSPFLDPGSLAFEHPERYGYRLFHKSLEEHRAALLLPSWRYTLNYETQWMTREQIVYTSYEAIRRLNKAKLKYGYIEKGEAAMLETRLDEEVSLMRKIDETMAIQDPERRADQLMQLRVVDSTYDFRGARDKVSLQWKTALFRFSPLHMLRVALSQVFHRSARL